MSDSFEVESGTLTYSEDQIIALNDHSRVNDFCPQNNINEWYSRMDQNLWYKLCRICAVHNDFLIPIYEGEGLEHELATKIDEYFPFKVSEKDGLPRFCCHMCVSMILSWNDLIKCSKKANEKFNSMLNCFISYHVPADNETEVNNDNETEKGYDVSLHKEIPVDTSNENRCTESDDNVVASFENREEIHSEKRETDKYENDGVGFKESDMDPSVGDNFQLTYKHDDISGEKYEHEYINKECIVQPNKYHGAFFDLRNNDDHIETIHRLADGDRNLLKYYDKAKGVPEPELQAYKFHMPMKYLSVNGYQFLRTKVFGFEPHHVGGGENEEVNSMFFICCLCKDLTKDSDVIRHSKSHYPLKMSDSCKICHFGFTSINCFRSHLKKHTVYIDEECKKPIDDLENVNNVNVLEKPIELLDDENDLICKTETLTDTCENFSDCLKIKCRSDFFICEYCGITYRLKKTFLQHIRRAHVSPYICKLCKKRFTAKDSLKKHKCVQIICNKPGRKVKWLNCKCKKIFLFEEQYLEHIKSCDKANYLPCQDCGREFPDKIKLDMHILRQHIKLKEVGEKRASVWICEICGCHLSAVSARKHYLTHSFVKKKFTCSTCEMKFIDKNGLEKHVQSHSDARPFSCNICKATFKRKDHLKMHMKNKHNALDDKKYECRKCKRYFSTQFYLIRHQRLHSQGVSYECSVCKSRYPTEQSLKMHQTRTKHDSTTDCDATAVSLNTADWANRFRCNICNRRYGSITSLRKHAFIHHKEVVIEERRKTIDNDNDRIDSHQSVESMMKQDIIESVFECPTCNKRYLSEFGLKLHLSRSKHGAVKTTQKKKRKLIGILKAEKNPRFKCNECNEMFGTLLSLKMHKIKRKHFSKCPNCDKRFALDFKLRSHLIRVHHRRDIDDKINEFTQAEIMPHQCHYCKQKFAMHHNYMAHLQKKHNNLNDSSALNFIYIESDVFEQKTDGETPIVYHCTECWDNFFTEEEFHNHSHETTNVSNELGDLGNEITIQITKPSGCVLEIDTNKSLPAISNE